MVAEAEEFAADDEAQKKRIEALNSLSSYVYGLKSQLGDSDGLGGKLDSDDKKTLLDAIKETTEWIDSEGQSASADDLEEKLQEIQNIANPITAKLYSGSSTTPDDTDDEPVHDEL
jgi:heat shock protein 5